MQCFHSLALMLTVAASMGLPAYAAADRGVTVQGTVVSVQPDMGTFTVKSANGQELKLSVDPASQLRVTRNGASLKDFTAGASVLATYEMRDGKNRVLSATVNPVTLGDVNKKVQNVLESAKNYTFEHKDEYAQKLQNVLDDVNAQIGGLKAKAEKAGAEARRQLQPQIDELRTKSLEVQRQLEKVKNASPALWNDIKSGVHNALQDLQTAFDNMRDRLK
jgi:hypothetical protein